MALLWTGLMNVLLGVFNLLPGAPLDGGRVLRAVLWRVQGDRARAARTATTAGTVTGVVLVGLGVLELAVVGRLDGLWLMLIGWFLVQAAGTEQRAIGVRSAAAGAVAGDVMTPHPEVAAAWHTVRAFATVATRSRQAVFPVVGFSGEPQGVVTLELLARLPAQRAYDRIDAVAVTLAPEHTVAPDTPVASLVGRPPLAGALVAVVVDAGVLVGIITTDDLRRFVHLRQLQRLATPAPVPV
ncbi:MAG: hypothetical protein GEV07_11690 [Streptosporangiales bacterium]|nr:hypothetical protein [Streptosporangiales bacterium]